MGLGRTSLVVLALLAVAEIRRGGADVIVIQGNGVAGAQEGRLIIRVEPETVREALLPVVTSAYRTDRPVGPDLTSYVEALRSVEYERREKAFDRLLRLPANRLSDITTLLAKEEDPEAINRLTQVAAHLFLKARTPLEGTTALLGVQFRMELTRPDVKNAEDLRMSIHIVDLQPGYPAAQDLRVGDRVLGIDGKRFSLTMQDNDFVRIVREHAPGSMMRLEVLRGGEAMMVDLQLAALPANVADNVSSAILQRDQALRSFMETLAIRQTPALVVKDTTPPQGELELGETEVRILPQGGVLVLPRRIGN